MFRLSAPARSHTEMKLRHIRWADGQTSIDPEDYEVIDERGEKIGRIKRAIAVAAVRCGIGPSQYRCP
jgi:predicted secreted Zn-dependent protease